MEYGAFAPMEQMLVFSRYFQMHSFQRRKKALSWGKGLISSNPANIFVHKMSAYDAYNQMHCRLINTVNLDQTMI